jgi:hypothetical protein
MKMAKILEIEELQKAQPYLKSMASIFVISYCETGNWGPIFHPEKRSLSLIIQALNSDQSFIVEISIDGRNSIVAGV